MRTEAHIPAALRAEMLPEGSFIVPEAGVISLKGSESVDLLNRLSTNLLAGLPDRTPRKSVLTTEKGRVVDLIDVVRFGDDTLVLASDASAVAAWLRRYIIMEEIEVIDVTRSYTCAYIVGDKSINEVKDLLSADRAGFAGTHGTIESFAFPDDLWPAPILKFVGPPSLLENTALPPISMDIMEVYRIASGVPAYGKELSDSVNPLEAGLRRYINFSKGCYIGQEVIARIDTYDKQQRELIGCISDHEISAGETIFCGDTPSGWVTSAARSTRGAGFYALGFLKSGDCPFLRIGEGRREALRVVLPETERH